MWRWFDPRQTDVVFGMVIGLFVAIVWHVVRGG